MRETPVLVLAYNRPEKVRAMFEQLRVLKPERLIFNVDGPKLHIPGDAEKVAAVQDLVNLVNWTEKVETRFRAENGGLQAAVSDAVTHAVNTFGQVIVVEEDSVPGKHWFPYATTMLERYRDEKSIEHISGYNQAPTSVLRTGERGSRLTRYPASFAWATWDRAWKGFDPTLEWALNVSVTDLSSIVGSRAAALRWKQNFHDAASGRISTWAYRWLASMWSRDAWCLSPNANLVTYTGYEGGTHTVMKAPWTEQPLFDGDLDVLLDGTPHVDPAGEKWISDTIFAGTPYGVARGVAISAALAARKRYRAYKREQAIRRLG